MKLAPSPPPYFGWLADCRSLPPYRSECITWVNNLWSCTSSHLPNKSGQNRYVRAQETSNTHMHTGKSGRIYSQMLFRHPSFSLKLKFKKKEKKIKCTTFLSSPLFFNLLPTSYNSADWVRCHAETQLSTIVLDNRPGWINDLYLQPWRP